MSCSLAVIDYLPVSSVRLGERLVGDPAKDQRLRKDDLGVIVHTACFSLASCDGHTDATEAVCPP